MDDVKNIIESLLFVAEEPLMVDRIKRILSHAETREIRDALAELAGDYEKRRGGLLRLLECKVGFLPLDCYFD